MRPIHLGALISLGQSARFLFDVRRGWHIHGSQWIVGNIERLLSNLESLKFKVTLQAAGDLRRILADLKRYPDAARASNADQKRLHGTMQNLRLTLRAEARTLQAYLLTDKRLDVQRLVEKPESFLGKGTFSKLPEIAQLDIREAGKCIAFELPTAGAFHLLRATEDALRAYYKLYFKRGAMDRVAWGALTQNLQNKKRKPRPDQMLLAHLAHIRKNFRNPTDHPEKIYDMDGVQDLFSLVADVLNRIARELPETKALPWDDKLFKTVLKSQRSAASFFTEEIKT
jgi:hypothetical protein